MKQIFLESVLPDVPADTSKKRVRVRTFGLTETELEERVGGAVKGLEDVSIISSPRGIDLYIPRRDYEGGLKDEIEKALRSYIYTVGNDTLQEIVVERLISSGKTLASAESLTGGLAASLMIHNVQQRGEGKGTRSKKGIPRKIRCRKRDRVPRDGGWSEEKGGYGPGPFHDGYSGSDGWHEGETCGALLCRACICPVTGAW